MTTRQYSPIHVPTEGKRSLTPYRMVYQLMIWSLVVLLISVVMVISSPVSIAAARASLAPDLQSRANPLRATRSSSGAGSSGGGGGGGASPTSACSTGNGLNPGRCSTPVPTQDSRYRRQDSPDNTRPYTPNGSGSNSGTGVGSNDGRRYEPARPVYPTRRPTPNR